MTKRQAYWATCLALDIPTVFATQGWPWWSYLITGAAIAIFSDVVTG